MTEERRISAEQVRSLREATGAGMMDCKRALQESEGDFDQAVELLRRKGLDRAKGRAGRTASEGVIDSYIHFNNRVGVLVEVNCETDFVANTDEFRQLAKDVALHIASAKPRWVTRDEIPNDVIETERRVFEGQAREQGKPENVLERIVEGKLLGTEEGVALAAIQGLNRKLEEKEARIQELEQRLEKLERLLNRNNGGAK